MTSARSQASGVASLITACAVLSMAVGFMYVFNWPKLTEDATSATLPWGYTALSVGIVTLVLIALRVRLHKRLWRLLVSMTLGVTILLQLPPAVLWFEFNGAIIGDSPFEGPLGHWLWSVPHIFLLIASAYAICLLLARDRVVRDVC